MENMVIGVDCFTTKQFSEIVGISTKVLKKYNRQGILCPAIEIIRRGKTYRYYSPEQAPTAKALTLLWSVGVQPSIIRDYMHSRTPELSLPLMADTIDLLDNMDHMIHRARSILSMHLEMTQMGMRVSDKAISISVMPERRIILGGPNEFKEGEGYHGAYHRFRVAPHKPALDPSYKVGGYFDSMKAFTENPSQPTRFFSCDPNGHELMENRLYLVGYTRGPYGQTNDLPQRMKAFAEKNNLMFDGPVYNIYLIDELTSKDPNQYLLQASAALEEMSVMPNRRPLLHNKW